MVGVSFLALVVALVSFARFSVEPDLPPELAAVQDSFRELGVENDISQIYSEAWREQRLSFHLAWISISAGSIITSLALVAIFDIAERMRQQE